jgi:hypothetical protein
VRARLALWIAELLPRRTGTARWTDEGKKN